MQHEVCRSPTQKTDQGATELVTYPYISKTLLSSLIVLLD